MNDNFDQTLKKLGERVHKFTNNKNTTSYRSSLDRISSKINLKVILVYGTPFILTLIGLFFCKPNFISEEVNDNEGGFIIKVNFRKLIVSTFIIGGAISVLIFLYLRKKEIKL